MIFLDTSAIFALADGADNNHGRAKELLEHAIVKDEEFVLHNYIVIESSALIQRRLGLKETKKFIDEVKRFQIVWVDSSLHELAEAYFNKYATRKLSFVDCSSFIFMRQQGITQAFAFDEDFEKAGFHIFGT